MTEKIQTDSLPCSLRRPQKILSNNLDSVRFIKPAHLFLTEYLVPGNQET